MHFTLTTVLTTTISLFFSTPGSAQSAANQGIAVDVAVIGGGLAGLAAARRLVDANAGLKVVLLESKRTLGGRLMTDRSLGIPVDLGAGGFTANPDSPITTLVKNASIPFKPINYTATSYYDQATPGKEFSTDPLLQSALSSFNGFRATLETDAKSLNDSNPKDTLASAVLKVVQGLSGLNDQQKKWAYYMVGNQAANDYAEYMNDISLNEILRSKRIGADFGSFNDAAFTNGSEPLIAMLSKGIDVRTAQQVKNIAFETAGKVSIITTKTQSFRAKAVIVAVPLGVFQNHKLHFEPALPTDKEAALTNMGFATMNKMLMTFDQQLVDPSIQFLTSFPLQLPNNTAPSKNYTEITNMLNNATTVNGTISANLTSANDPNPPKDSVLTFINLKSFVPNAPNSIMAVTYGRFSLQLENMTDTDVVMTLMTQLQRAMGAQTVLPVPTSILKSSWASDNSFFGTHSYLSTRSQPGDIELVAKEILSLKWFFAGEYTSSEFQGTLRGAWESGVREADKVLAALGGGDGVTVRKSGAFKLRLGGFGLGLVVGVEICCYGVVSKEGRED
ncbi:hypothetical protein HDU76_005660 [Blyttiomyces sp. JEL0837]|nr:hypothetical protein HDU76_005660 [Blyttiomyces sp. JEL0837]